MTTAETAVDGALMKGEQRVHERLIALVETLKRENEQLREQLRIAQEKQASTS